MSTPQTSNKRRKKWKASASAEAKKLSFKEDDWSVPAGDGNSEGRRTRGRKNPTPGAKVMSPALTSPPSAVRVGAAPQVTTPSVEIATPTVATPMIARAPAPPPSAAGVCAPCSGDDHSSMSDMTDASSVSSKFIGKKPPSSRVIIEVDPVTKMSEEHLRCPKCNHKMCISFPTRCIATAVRLDCTNKSSCAYSCLELPSAAAEVLDDDDDTVSRERNTDCAVNALHVLSFVASGDGGTEAARLLGLLGLPNNTTMQARSFGNMEKQLSGKIQQLADDIIMENLRKEARVLLGDKVDNDGNKHYDLWLERKLPREHWPKMHGCADMGWNQKGTGRKRNSKSGHAFMCAMETRSIVAKALCSKGCGHCKCWCTTHTIDEVPPEHDCKINFEGSSGAMEPVATLEMYKWLHEQQVIVEHIVADDDSSIKAKLKWNNEDHEFNTGKKATYTNTNGEEVIRPKSKDHGAIPRHMPQPLFVADPNHRRKTLATELHNLQKPPKTDPKEDEKKGINRKRKTQLWNLGVSKMDCRRLSKNFGFMARQPHKHKTDAEKLKAGRAVLEHHFDVHDCCDTWCPRKDNMGDKSKFYRSKEKEPELYSKLSSIMARFVTLEALNELCHRMDTCANESFNNTIAWLAPKNKVYCGADSLKNRICIAIGITTLGTHAYYTRLFQLLGIHMTEDVEHYLRVKGTGRAKRIAKTKTRAYKKKRKAEEFEKIKKETAEAAKRRDGSVHQSGIGMAGGCEDDDNELNKKPAAKKAAPKNNLKKSKKNKKGEEPVCSKCGEAGHWRPTNKKCRHYVPKGVKAATTASIPAPVENVGDIEATTKASDSIDVGADESTTVEEPATEEVMTPPAKASEEERMADEACACDSLPLFDDDSDSEAYYSAASQFSNSS